MLIDIPDTIPLINLVRFAAENGFVIDPRKSDGAVWAFVPATWGQAEKLLDDMQHIQAAAMARCSGREVMITLSGTTYTRDQVRELIRQINEETGSGAFPPETIAMMKKIVDDAWNKAE